GGAAWQSAAAHGIFKACRNVFGIASFYRQRWHAHIVLFVLVQIFVLRGSVAAIAPCTLRACTQGEAPGEKCKKMTPKNVAKVGESAFGRGVLAAPSRRGCYA
ncbi:hypothetical protein, partial [Diaphorobacter sp.]|uniref:hypothetical protein n=1 Tax=Diaphorobacter sp. TaxID=1934310 RepID=UPI00258D2E71